MTAPPRLAPGVRRIGPDLLAGGTPLRVLRLSAAGQDALDALLAGRAHAGAAALRGRLLAGGLLLPEPGPGCLAELTVVVPVRGSADEVRRTLVGVPPGVPVVVVDDASPRPLAAQLTAQVPGVTVVRHERGRGAAAARNTGWARASTGLVAFVDADVEVPPGVLQRLTGHFGDERIVAAAPRVVSRPDPGLPGLVGVLETRLCALDQGPDPAEVRPEGPVGYVPSATLVVRRAALAAVGGFDESLWIGEDVDLVWRLLAQGAVRYDPSVAVRHGPRPTLRAALRRRRDYGASAALLDRRHPGLVRHLAVSPWSALPWVAALAHPLTGAVTAAALVVSAPRGLAPLPPAEARRVAAQGQWASCTALGRYAVRPAWPLAAGLLLASRRVRRLAPALAVGYVAGSWGRLAAGGLRELPARLVAHVLDDLAYTAGVWRGAVAGRQVAVLLPRVLPLSPERTS